ncbi:MAG: energy transducer TonB [Thiobacillus sp.]
MHARPDLAPIRFLPRSPRVLAAVMLAHAAVIALLLNAPRGPQPITPPQPLLVRLVEPAPPPAPPVAAPTPPAPQPPQRLPRPTPVPVVPAPTPQPVATPTPHPVEAPAEPVRGEVAPAAPAAPVVDAPRPAAPPPLVQPRFNADYLDNPKPAYPSISRRMGEEGEVRLRVWVDATGNAQQVEVERTSGYPRLDAAALETVKRWRFVPARQGEQAVAAWVIVPIQFTLRN